MQQNHTVQMAGELIESVNHHLTEISEQIAGYHEWNQPVSRKAPLVITFAGRFKTGKSSLINALIGMDILPVRATTATAVVTRITKGSNEQAYLYENGEKMPITMAHARQIILNYQVEDPKNPVEIIFELPIPWLSEEVEIRDTPGMDDSSQDGALEEIAMHALEDTDLCICVYDAGAFPGGRERERTKKICSMLNGNVVYVVNCINHVNSREGLKLVEKNAETLFQSMDYSLEGMGRYYLICSAPEMLSLAGFDQWFREVSGKSSLNFKNLIRANTVSCRIQTKSQESIERINGYMDMLYDQKMHILELHEGILKEQRERIRKEALIKKNQIRLVQNKAAGSLVDVSLLVSKLSSAYSNTVQMNHYGNNYAKMSREITASYFRNQYESVCKSNPDYYDTKRYLTITEAVNVLEFPGKHSCNVAATGGEKVGGAAIGAGIGFLFGPVGAAIGAAIGGAIGASDTIKDDSVSNTMTFVRRSVVPAVQAAFADITQKIIAEYNMDAEKQISNSISGYEALLKSLDCCTDECKRKIRVLRQCQKITGHNGNI